MSDDDQLIDPEDDVYVYEPLSLSDRNLLIKKTLEDVFSRGEIDGELKEFVGACIIKPTYSISDLRYESDLSLRSDSYFKERSGDLSKLITPTNTLKLIGGYYQQRVFKINPNFIIWKDFCFYSENFSYSKRFELVIRSEYFLSNVERFGIYNKQTEISTIGERKLIKSRLYMSVLGKEDNILGVTFSIVQDGKEHHFEDGYEKEFVFEPLPENDCGIFIFHEEGGLVKPAR